MFFAVLSLLVVGALAKVLPNHVERPDNILIKRGLTPPGDGGDGWQYYGCYTDSAERALKGSFTSSPNMDNNLCIAYCRGKGYSFAGTEYAQECFCGYALASSSQRADAADCSMPCGGNAAQPCGGGYRLTVYTNRGNPAESPATSNGFRHLGCYSDDVGRRALGRAPAGAPAPSQMTVDGCTLGCARAGFAYAGLEYAGECYCDQALGSAAQLQAGDAASSGCDMTCNGNRTQWCGGSNRLNVYSAAPSSSTTTSGTTATVLSVSTSSAPPSTATDSVSATTSTSASTSTAPAVSQIVRNPAFVSGMSNWIEAPDPAQTNVQWLRASTSSGPYAHSPDAFLTIGGSGYGVSGERNLCVYQELYFLNNGTYNLEFFIGGISNFQPDPRVPNQPSLVSMKWSVDIAGQSFGGSVCYSGCSTLSTGGKAVYNRYAYQVGPIGSSSWGPAPRLRICAK